MSLLRLHSTFFVTALLVNSYISDTNFTYISLDSPAAVNITAVFFIYSTMECNYPVKVNFYHNPILITQYIN